MDATDRDEDVLVEADRALRSLVSAVGRGELDLREFDNRSAAVARATTVAQVRAALPGSRAGAELATPQAPATEPSPSNVPAVCVGSASVPGWRQWATAGAINLLVWVVIAVAAGPVYFWPMWVIGPWGLVLAVRGLHRSVTDADPPATGRHPIGLTG